VRRIADPARAFPGLLTRSELNWGEQNDVQVAVDHVDYTRLPALAAAEAHAQRGHDIFGFLSPPAAYEDQVIDHASIIGEIERHVGPYSDLGMKSTYNPRTKGYFGVSDNYVPAPVLLASRPLELNR
jgi:multiple sugar transport system substrate-binding protein